MKWIETIENQKYVNHRIDDAEVIMFYEPGWFESTETRTTKKQEKVVVLPKYQGWFMAAAKGSSFIRDLKGLFIDTLALSYEKTVSKMKAKGL